MGEDDNGDSARFVLEDVPLNNEHHADAIFPESQHDTDHLSNVQSGVRRRQSNEHARDELRKRRRTDQWWRVLRFIEGRGLLPRSWTRIDGEAGERYPRFVCVLRDNYRVWGKSAMAAVSCVGTIVWLISWLLGAPSIVMHDGTNVVNLWSPSYASQYSLADGSFADWISHHRGHSARPGPASIRSGYFGAEVYGAGARRNVTLDWLHEALAHECGEKGTDARCHCMAAVEIGVLANVVLLGGSDDNHLAIDPSITDSSSEAPISIEYDDGTKAMEPLAVIAEYTTRGGRRERRNYKLYHAFCMSRSIRLVGG